MTRRAGTALAVLALTAPLAACGGSGGGSGTGGQTADDAVGDSTSSSTPAPAPGAMPTALPPAEGEVTGEGTVLDLGPDKGGPRLCLLGQADSYPPQCDGVPLGDWDWSALDGTFDQVDETRFASYVVTGTFDGTTLTPTRPPLSTALHDPPPVAEPELPPVTVERSDEELQEIARTLRDLPGGSTSSPGDGRVEVAVVHDDGSLQAWADATYGAGAVVVFSALRPTM